MVELPFLSCIFYFFSSVFAYNVPRVCEVPKAFRCAERTANMLLANVPSGRVEGLLKVA